MATESLQTFRERAGLWIRMAVAGLVAVLGFVLLFVIEIAAIAVMSMFMLVLGAPAVAVLLLFIGLWLGIAGVYRRLMPAPLIVGRISNKWLQGLEQFAREFSTPNEALVLRSFAPMLGGLIAWVVGYTIVESTPLISRLEAVLAVGLLCGVIGATYYTGRTIAGELGRGGTVEEHLAEDIDVIENDSDADEVLAETATSSLAELQARVDRLAAQAGVPAPTVRLGRERRPVAATAGFRPTTSTIAVSVGLCDRLSTQELEAVLAHELAHVVNRDAAILTALALPNAKFDTLLDNALADPHDDSASPFQIHPMVLLAALPVIGLTRASVILVTRYREYVADRGAVALTGDPAALASALETLDQELTRRPASDLRTNRSTAVFSIVPPPWEEHRFFDRTRRFIARTLLGTHPATEKRIERLRTAAADAS
ncbi:M48 family metallopeptidase [Natronolimnobius sp. AArcel1]|uniref:M48 family metallopeptidase n=1 Tax=Natronolimnobius sp. AArcel1 TaxID=1679093 RepID=UPI001F150329|nr:M48 family metalloprotease [Natronolimnobius sp. AArcel1]